MPEKMIEKSKMTDCCQLLKITDWMNNGLFFQPGARGLKNYLELI